MTGTGTALLDERSTPPLRARIGHLLASAEDAMFAVRRIRLGVLDLTDPELATVQRCRVLLGQLDASVLLDAAEGTAAGPTASLAPLLRFAGSGRLEVRSAGVAGWSPDFAVVRAGERAMGMVGAIYFGSPDLVVGPALTVPVTGDDATALLRSRFDELWARSHDVLPAIREVLEHAHGLEDPARRGALGVGPDPPVR